MAHLALQAMVKPFEARCKGHLSGASGALIPGGTTSKPTGAWGGGMSKPTGAAPCKMSQMLMSNTCGATDMTCKAQALGGATGACWKCAVAVRRLFPTPAQQCIPQPRTGGGCGEVDVHVAIE